MKTIYRNWNCWRIIANNQYVVTLGSGVTVLNRVTLELVHHFTGIKYIHGGLFLNDDILVVFTGEQRLYYFQISEKKVLWTCPRPRQLASSGSIRCCLIPGTTKVACIAAGKRAPKEHFFLLADYEQHTLSIQKLLNCYRVVHSLVWTEKFGLSYLTYEAKGNGKLLYRIAHLQDDGTALTISEWESYQTVNAYSGNYLFMNDNSNQEPRLAAYQLSEVLQMSYLAEVPTFSLSLPLFYTNGPVGAKKSYLPTISWIDERSGLLTACTNDWLGAYNFVAPKLITECRQTGISCGTILDEKLLVGCTPGLMVEELNKNFQ